MLTTQGVKKIRALTRDKGQEDYPCKLERGCFRLSVVGAPDRPCGGGDKPGDVLRFRPQQQAGLSKTSNQQLCCTSDRLLTVQRQESPRCMRDAKVGASL